MAITYRVSKCKNPKNADGEYLNCKAVKTSDYTFEDIAEDIAESTTVTKADAMAVLAAIRPKIKSALLAGRRVVLNDLGYFIIGITGKCFSKEAASDSTFVPSSMIKGHRVRFRPEPKLKKEIALAIKYQRISSEEMA